MNAEDPKFYRKQYKEEHIDKGATNIEFEELCLIQIDPDHCCFIRSHSTLCLPKSPTLPAGLRLFFCGNDRIFNWFLGDLGDAEGLELRLFDMENLTQLIIAQLMRKMRESIGWVHCSLFQIIFRQARVVSFKHIYVFEGWLESPSPYSDDKTATKTHALPACLMTRTEAATECPTSVVYFISKAFKSYNCYLRLR